MRAVAVPVALLVCGVVPLFFRSPASTIGTADEFAALAEALGPGDHCIGAESLRITGEDTLTVTVTGCLPLLPPRNPGVVLYTPLPGGVRFLLVPGDPP